MLDGITDHSAINVSRKNQQHLQALSLVRATRRQRLAIAPDVSTDCAAIDVRREKSAAFAGSISLACDAVAALCHRAG